MLASSTASIYMMSTLAMGIITFFSILVVLLLGVWLVAFPLRFFWGRVIKGLIKQR